MNFATLLLALLTCQDGAPTPAAAKVDDHEVGGKPYIEIYDIRDLLPSYRDGKRPLDQGPQNSSEASASGDEAQAMKPSGKPPLFGELPVLGALFRHPARDEDADCRTVLRALMQCFGANLDEGLTCEIPESGAMVLRARAATHKRVDDFLLALRTQRAPQLSIEVAIYELDADDREELAEYVTPHGGKVDGRNASQVDPKLFLDFIAKRHTNQLTSPRIVTAPLVGYEVSAGSLVAYVAGMDQVAIEGLGTIADPVIKQLFEGLVISGVGVAMESIGTMPAPYALKLQTHLTVLKRPIATVQSDIGTVQLPETRHTDFGTTIAGFLGSPVIVGGVPKPNFDGDDETRLYLMVTVKPVNAR